MIVRYRVWDARRAVVAIVNLTVPVEDLTASRRGSEVDLDWTLPRKNTDRTLSSTNPSPGSPARGNHSDGNLQHVLRLLHQLHGHRRSKRRSAPGAVRIHYVDKLPPQLGMENPAGFVTYAVEE